MKPDELRFYASDGIVTCRCRFVAKIRKVGGRKTLHRVTGFSPAGDPIIGPEIADLTNCGGEDELRLAVVAALEARTQPVEAPAAVIPEPVPSPVLEAPEAPKRRWFALDLFGRREAA